MKRLTSRNDEGIAYLSIIEELPQDELKITGNEELIDSMCQAWEILAQYEETHLTPAQIYEMDILYAEKCKEVANLTEKLARLDKFDNTQTAAVMEKYAAIVMCKECEYKAQDPNGYFWCRSTGGIEGLIKDSDGCSRGRRSEQ